MNGNRQRFFAISISLLLSLCSLSLMAQADATSAKLSSETSDETNTKSVEVVEIVDMSLEPLLPFEVVYDVGNNLISAGSAKLSLTRDGDEWVYNLSTRPTGVFKLTGKGKIQETSVFTVVKSADDVMRVQPKRYSYRQDEEAKRSVDAWFNWDSNELTYQSRGEEGIESFSDPVLDRLSVTLKVMDELKHRPFEEAKLTVFDSGHIKQVLFINEGTEVVSTKIGDIKTVRVRSVNAGSSRHTLTWFAPELDFVPVKIEQHKRDKLVARLTLVKLSNHTSK